MDIFSLLVIGYFCPGSCANPFTGTRQSSEQTQASITGRGQQVKERDPVFWKDALLDGQPARKTIHGIDLHLEKMAMEYEAPARLEICARGPLSMCR